MFPHFYRWYKLLDGLTWDSFFWNVHLEGKVKGSHLASMHLASILLTSIPPALICLTSISIYHAKCQRENANSEGQKTGVHQNLLACWNSSCHQFIEINNGIPCLALWNPWRDNTSTTNVQGHPIWKTLCINSTRQRIWLWKVAGSNRIRCHKQD